ncbi:hypothetical protein PCE1_002462 [Barthelona sp. PCE]
MPFPAYTVRKTDSGNVVYGSLSFSSFFVGGSTKHALVPTVEFFRVGNEEFVTAVAKPFCLVTRNINAGRNVYHLRFYEFGANCPTLSQQLSVECEAFDCVTVVDGCVLGYSSVRNTLVHMKSETPVETSMGSLKVITMVGPRLLCMENDVLVSCHLVDDEIIQDFTVDGCAEVTEVCPGIITYELGADVIVRTVDGRHCTQKSHEQWWTLALMCLNDAFQPFFGEGDVIISTLDGILTMQERKPVRSRFKHFNVFTLSDGIFPYVDLDNNELVFGDARFEVSFSFNRCELVDGAFIAFCPDSVVVYERSGDMRVLGDDATVSISSCFTHVSVLSINGDLRVYSDDDRIPIPVFFSKGVSEGPYFVIDREDGLVTTKGQMRNIQTNAKHHTVVGDLLYLFSPSLIQCISPGNMTFNYEEYTLDMTIDPTTIQAFYHLWSKLFVIQCESEIHLIDLLSKEIVVIDLSCEYTLYKVMNRDSEVNQLELILYI